jgi:hypothetical protein
VKADGKQSRTSVDFQRITRRYNSENSTLQATAVRTSNPTSDVMFDNKNSYEIRLKISKHDAENGRFKYFSSLKIMTLVLKFMKNQILKFSTSHKQLLDSLFEIQEIKKKHL